MKKIFFILISAIFITLFIFLAILSTTGIKTSKFNNFITNKINNINNHISLDITSIKFKLDLKQISLFLETDNTEIQYKHVSIPLNNIKVYMDFISLIKSEPRIYKIILTSTEINENKLKNISTFFKPSNLASLIKNKLKKIELNAELEIYLNKENTINNFITRGTVSNFKIEVFENFHLENINFKFFADQEDVLLKNISSESNSLKVYDSDLKLNFSQKISLETNLKTQIKFNSEDNKIKKVINKFNFLKDLRKIDADLTNRIKLNFDQTYKIEKFDLNSKGKILKGEFIFDEEKIYPFINKKINNIFVTDTKFDTNFSQEKSKITISGKYSLNENTPLNFDLTNNFIKNSSNLELKFDYKDLIEFDIINYKKNKNKIAQIFLNLNKNKESLRIKKISLTEGKNLIYAEDLLFKNNKFLSSKKISVLTYNQKNKNNDFTIVFGKKIKIEGDQFDATKIPKILSQNNKQNNYLRLNKEIEIDFINIIAPLSENLKNFKLIGKIENGKFIKITSKGDFGNNNFLDISMKKDENSNKKYLEVYSDLSKPLLTEFSFFEGLSGGNLLYTSVIDENNSLSKLKVQNFKVINAPGMVKLLSLADLSGLADLAQGDGLTFNTLEISMEKNNEILKLNEIIAIGPSISVLMEGYQDSKLTSLKGTLIPAKTLNKMISKIPVLGEIIIPKEIGEGLFGISFKMKGPKGKIKTTINPIKTLTPRFIQKIIEKNKNLK